MKLSIIIPVYNEEENLSKLQIELKFVLDSQNFDHEIIYVNDGSRDRSQEVLRKLTLADPNTKVISFVRNFGQTAALAAGIICSKGDVLIFMDSDLQNDPADIPRLLDLLNNGYDVVSGWRKNRKDKALSRRLPSNIANWLISAITGVYLHDYGCTLKAYRRRVIEDLRLYGEMHRFIPAYVSWYGARVAEIIVNHRPRIYGKSKYGINRTLKVLLDLLVAKFWSSYLAKPMHFFGGAGFLMFLISLLAGFWAIYLKIFHNVSFIITPLPLLSVFAAMIGLQFILIGIIAEILTRIYYESSNTHPFKIKEKINF